MNEIMNSDFNTFSSSGTANFVGSTSSKNEGLLFNVFEQPDCLIVDDIANNDDGKYSVFDIANWFLHKAAMTHKKLQKLCYYAQAWAYALRNIRLEDTDFQAWVHGPVSPVLYDRFKQFGYDQISLVGDYKSSIAKEDEELLEKVWETYGDHTGNALAALSHTERPWIDARVGYRPEERCAVPISPELMKEYYRSIYMGE